jgi:hypothetical protein
VPQSQAATATLPEDVVDFLNWFAQDDDRFAKTAQQLLSKYGKEGE